MTWLALSVVLMSPTTKLVPGSSLKVKVMTAVCPPAKVPRSLLMLRLGRVVAMAKDTLLLASAPSALVLAAALAKVALATLTLPGALLLASGV